MLTTYFKIRLRRLGYVDVEVRYSLGYSQGDGVAFYGRLDDDSLTLLADRLLEGAEKAAVTRAMKKGWCLEIQGESSRYHHYNSMRVEENGDYSDPYPNLTHREKAACDALFVLIKEDVQDVSQTLDREGYNILQALCPSWWWKHEGERLDGRKWGTIKIALPDLPGGLKAFAYLEECESYNPYFWGNGHEDHLDVVVLAKSEVGVCDILVEILDGEIVIGSDDRSDVDSYLNGDGVRAVIAECLEGAKDEARAYIASVRNRFEGVEL
jgi:hypothetical protein